MTKQVIGVGTVANDGTGDTIRGAMNKINSNFSDIYSTYGDGSTLREIAVAVTAGPSESLLYYSPEGSITDVPGLSFDSSNNRIRFVRGDKAPDTSAFTITDFADCQISLIEYSDSPETHPAVFLTKRRGNLQSPMTSAAGDNLGAYAVNGGLYSQAAPTFLAGQMRWVGVASSTEYEINSKFELQVRVDDTIVTALSSNDDGSVRISDAYNLPQVDGVSGQVLASDGNGNLYWSNSINQIASDLSVDTIKFNDNTASNDEAYIRSWNVPLFFATQNRLLIGTENQEVTTGIGSSAALYIAGDIWGSRQDGTPSGGWKYKRIHLGGHVNMNSDFNAVPVQDPTEWYWFESAWAKEGHFQSLTVGGDGYFSTDSYEFPTVDGTAGQTLTTDGDGTLQWSNLFSLDQLKTVVAASTDFADFQARIAAL